MLSPAAPLRERLARHRVLLWLRYSTSSVIAGVISQLVFALCYGLGSAPLVATVIAFLAGAVPNYVLTRYWTWQRRGPADRTRELLPYVVIVVVNAAVATLTTTLADAWLRPRIESQAWQTLLVSVVFVGTYGVLFILKFVLFDRLVFASRDGAAERPRTPATR